MAINFLQPSFAAGEISPNLYARVDLAKYHIACKLLRNFFTWPSGGVSNRAGSMFVGRCKDSTEPVHLIPFQFNILQAYMLEFGHLYMRVIMDGGYVLEPDSGISAITNANPGILTVTGTAYNNGDQVFIAGTATQLDSTPGRQYLVANSTVTNTTDYSAGSVSTAIQSLGQGVITTAYVNEFAVGTAVYISGTGTPLDGNAYLIGSVRTLAWGMPPAFHYSYTLTDFNGNPIDTTYSSRTGTISGAVTGATQTTCTFTLTDLDGNAIDTTNFTAYGGSGGTVARVFTLVTPYAGADVRAIKWTQSADILTLCHPNYPPQDLTRSQHWAWTLTEVDFAPQVSAPTGVTFTNVAGTSGYTDQKWHYSYVVTAISNTPPDESLPSAAYGGTGYQLNSAAGAYNEISWTQLSAAMYYRVYKANPTYNLAIDPTQAMYGYIGTAKGPSFVDTEIAPDFTQCPPQGTNPFLEGPITSVTVTNGGSGYDPSIILNVSDVSGTGAVLTPTFSNGLAATLSVNAAGSGYSTASGLSTTGGTGTGLLVNITASGTISAATVAFAGTGYAVNDIVTVVQTGGSSGTLKVTAITDGVIASVAVVNGGKDYQAPVVTPGNLGSGAAGTINVISVFSGVQSITVTLSSGGQNYFGNVTVTAASGGTGCTFKAIIVNGIITHVTCSGTGHGYTDGDALVFTQNTGSGATFSVTVTPSGNYPSCATYFQQRKVFAGSNSNPQTIWMTRPADFKNMDISNPSQASDAIVATIASNQVNAIKWLVPMNNLVILSSGGAWLMVGGQVASPIAVTPTNTIVVPQNYIGCGDLPPIVINYDILYVQAKGSIVRDLAYNFWVNVYTGTDMSVLAQHLFFGHNMERWCYAEQPFYQVWIVRDDGILLSFTYLKEQDVYAWAHHDSPGNSGTDTFESVASIPEQQVPGINMDSVYFVVQRTIPGVNNGNPVKYIERMDGRNMLTNGVADVTKAWFVDCGLRYSGAPTAAISGLDHLNGATVSILADGSVQPQQVVSGGSITLQWAASVVTVGLPYQSQLRTLCMEPEGMAMQVQDYRKRIYAVAVRVADTRGLKVGPDFDNLTEIKERSALVSMGQPIPLFTGDERVVIDAQYEVDDDVCVQQDSPLPCTILGIIPEVVIGDSPG